MRGPCLLRTSQVQLSNEQTELTWTVPSKHVLRTYNALISAVEQVTVGKGDRVRSLPLEAAAAEPGVSAVARARVAS